MNSNDSNNQDQVVDPISDFPELEKEVSDALEEIEHYDETHDLDPKQLNKRPELPELPQDEKPKQVEKGPHPDELNAKPHLPELPKND